MAATSIDGALIGPLMNPGTSVERITQPTKPFNIKTLAPEEGNPGIVDDLKELSYIKYGHDRAEVEEEIMERYSTMD